MFDIKNAVEAALGITRDKARRFELVRFLERASETDLPVCQWRTVGGDSDIIEKFLTEVGFNSDDYAVITSKLDPSVRTFRWGGTGKYETLRAALAESKYKFREDGDLFVAMALRINNGELTDEEIVKGLEGHVSDEVVSDGAVSTMADMLDLAKITTARYEEYNKAFPEDPIIPGDEAVPDLARIEKICRGLRLTKEPSTPVFAENPTGRQIRTVMRHFGLGERLNCVNLYASTIVPAAFQCETARDEEANPLHGYLYRDRDTCSKVKSSLSEGVMLFGYEEVRRNVDAYSFTSSPIRTHEYVIDLYSKFFGIPKERIGIAPWSLTAYSESANTEDTVARRDATKAATMLDMDPSELVAYKYQILLGRKEFHDASLVSFFTDHEYGDNGAGVIVVSPDIKEDEFCDKAVVSSDLEAEWYDTVHRFGSIRPARYNTYQISNSSLAKHRTVWHRRRTESALRKDASFDDNQSLVYDDVTGDRRGAPTSAFLVYAGLAIKNAAGSDGIVRCTREGSPGGHVVSRVFSEIVDQEDPSAYDVLKTTASTDEFIDNALKRQIKGRNVSPKTDVYRLIVETNAKLAGTPASDFTTKLKTDIADSFATTFIYGRFSYSSAGRSDVNPSFLFDYDFERRYFRNSVSSSTWFEYDPSLSMLSPSDVISCRGSTLLSRGLIKVAVGTDSNGRIVIVIDVSGRIRNIMMTSLRIRDMVPPVDAYGLVELSPREGSGTHVYICPEDGRDDPDNVIEIRNLILSSLHITPVTGWTQSASPYYGLGHPICYAGSYAIRGGLCPSIADFRDNYRHTPDTLTIQ